MNKMIAYCGLDCDKCEARIATRNNDNALRQKVADLWSQLNDVEITPEMINCDGCKVDGLKTYYCGELCQIRKCAMEKALESCGKCPSMNSCSHLEPVLSSDSEAVNNLKKA